MMPDGLRETDSYTVFAGSAIKQGKYVGRIDDKSQWNPTGKVEPRWLLLSGASDPPKTTVISERRPRSALGDNSGAFLDGVTHDLTNMENAVRPWLHNTVRALDLTKREALDRIRKLFDYCKKEGAKPMLYYTGHGEVGTGNWCFQDGTIGIQEILDMVPEGERYPMIFSDACYSGHWANFCLNENINGFHCLAACPDYSAAIDTKGKGGDLTLFMTGNKQRPSTEPVYSGGDHKRYPLNSDIDCHTYGNLIRGLIKNTNRIVIAQTIHNGQLSVGLATSEVYSERSCGWGIQKNFDTFMKFVRGKWEGIDGEPKRIYSLVCDKNLGFGVFFIENYGTKQTVLRGTAHINKNLKDDFKITACAARDSYFYVVMTKGTIEYEDKEQTWFTCRYLNEARNIIETEYRKGKMITGICCSTEKQEYFLVTTKIPEEHCYNWFYDSTDGHAVRNRWYRDKVEEGFRCALIFKDPENSIKNRFLLVMTKNENISINEILYNFRLK